MFRLGPRAQAVVVLALVATVGALAGIIGDRYIAQRSADATGQVDTRPVGPRTRMPLDRGGAHAPGGNPRAGQMNDVRFVEMLTRTIDLTEEQRVALDSILTEQRAAVQQLDGEFRPRFRAIAEQTRRGINELLTPEQRRQLRDVRQRAIENRTADRPRDR